MPVNAEARSKPRILYLIGTARCGSTALAAMLSLHEAISWRGELIHLVTAVSGGSLCSCGQAIVDCEVWQRRSAKTGLQSKMQYCHQFESHLNSIATLANPARVPDEYGQKQTAIVQSLCDDGAILLDSSKYIGRALALASSDVIDARFIYLVRDPRGVAYSYSKKVQSGRGLLSACMYYSVVNVVAEIAVRWRLRGRVVKIRYEDLLSDPKTAMQEVCDMLEIDSDSLLSHLEEDPMLQAEHVAGGNRWVRSGGGRLRQDIAWRSELSSVRQLLVHILCIPLQLLNRYRL